MIWSLHCFLLMGWYSPYLSLTEQSFERRRFGYCRRCWQWGLWEHRLSKTTLGPIGGGPDCFEGWKNSYCRRYQESWDRDLQHWNRSLIGDRFVVGLSSMMNWALGQDCLFHWNCIACYWRVCTERVQKCAHLHYYRCKN